MTIGIMQPYFLPYIGYWQLMNAVDKFIIYDKIQYTKKGWIHRNRFLQNGKDVMFSLSLKKDSDYLDIDKRYLAEINGENVEKIIRQIENSYIKAPFFNEVMPVIVKCLKCPEINLFSYIYHSINTIKEYLKIDSELVISSTLTCDNTLKSQDKVLNICKTVGATNYINAIGGKALYSNDDFKDEGINLFFIKTGNIVYSQFKDDFVPNLSILDVMMFNPVDKIRSMLCLYSLE